MQSRPNRSGTWKSVVELSAETEDLLYQVMLMNNFDGPDEAFKDALRYYIDSQCGVELNPELAASLSKALRNSEDSHVMTAQEARNRIHEWVLQASSQRLQ
ncbi:MAG TPA: hypothetical protein VK604_27600 [Bryobacteraceae bacterium]|nr:hypothetical protein [Bryobacteraceae bacterium]